MVLIQAGVSKLTEARHVVDALKSQAAGQEQKLAEKQAKANSALQMITETMRSANTQKVEMESLKEQTERESLQLMERYVVFLISLGVLYSSVSEDHFVVPSMSLSHYL